MIYTTSSASESIRLIISAKGCVVADDQLCSGRRYVAIDERNELKNKPRDNQKS
jgi:hypothetical protein